MDYCGPRGVPHSHFLGGPAVWSDMDREKALAWQDKDRRTCGGCGTRREQWDTKQGGDRRAFIADIDICPGCEQVERMQNVASGPEYESVRGKRVVLRPPHNH